MELKGKRVLVVGLGESGLAMAKWLHRQGALVRVADSRENPPNREALACVAPDAEVVAGPFVAASFAGIDIVALSPGVPKATPAIAAVDVPVISEIELFATGVREQAPGSKIIAITGSNGKTTTTALTAHLLNGAGVPAIACGNISPSALDALMDALDAGSLPEVWVVELSSFQLETTHHLKADAATVLNVSEDHLDRYDGSLANYAAAKSRVFQGKGAMILNRDDDWSMANGRCGRRMLTFGLNAAPRGLDYGLVDGARRRLQAERHHRPAAAAVGHRPVVVAIEHHDALALEDAPLGGGIVGHAAFVAVEVILGQVEQGGRRGVQVMRRFQLEAGQFDHPDLR